MSEIVEKSNPKLTVAENTNSSSTGELQKCSGSIWAINKKNYLKWSQAVQTFLKGKDNLSHLLGTRPKYDPRIPW